MKRRHATAPLLLLALAGILGTLALPGGRGGSTAPASGGSAARTPAQESFAALVSDAAQRTLSAEERAAHLDRLGARGPQVLLRLLDGELGPDSPDEVREVALESLATCATGRELVSLVSVAKSGRPGSPPSAPVLAGLRAAVLRTLERDPRGFEALVPAWQEAGSERRDLRAELLAAVRERGEPAGLEFLAWIATFETGAYDREVAEACVTLAPRAWTAEERAALERIAVLLDTADARSVQVLTGALAAARLEAAIPAWIERLASDSRALSTRAEQALRQVTGLSLGPDPERWQAWHASELAWAEREGPALLAELDADDEARVLAALRALGARRLGRDALALEVARLLAHPSPLVRRQVCATLRGLGSTLVLPDLADALDDEDDAVVTTAAAALRQLTGLDLPPESDAWNAALARTRS